MKTTAPAKPAPLPDPNAPPASAAKPRRRPRPPVTHCLNCGQAITGRFCASCGQEAHDQSVALGTLASELASEIVSFDSKLLRTVVPLLFRPGFLTTEFLQGRRVRYLSPLKMYLVISALFFLAVTHAVPMQKLNLVSVDLSSQGASDARAARQDISRDLGKEAAAAQSVRERARLLAAKAKVDAALGKITPPPPAKHAIHVHTSASSDGDFEATIAGTLASYDTKQRALPLARRDKPLKRFLTRQLIKSQQDKQALVQGFLDDLPRMMFVLLPAFALLLKMTYFRTRRLYVSHLIFALHTHSFVFLLLTGALLLPHIPRETAFGAAFLLIAAYLYAAQKRVYGQGWGRTLLAFGWLGFNYLFLLTFAFVLTVFAALLLA